MGRYTHNSVEYFVDGPNKNGKWNWRVVVKGKKYAGDANSKSGAENAAKEKINNG